MNKSVLLVTLPPTRGGVPTKTRILAQFLRRRGHDVCIAHYATMSEYGDYSATLGQILLGKSSSIGHGRCFGDFSSIAVGCALPELEFTYCRSSSLWQSVFSRFDRHIAVGGTVLVSNPLSDLGIPHMTWCASTMIDDRFARRQAMPPYRRMIDIAIVGPIQRAMEKRILGTGTRFMTVSNYARETLINAGGNPANFQTVPVPVDQNFFSPPDTAPEGIIGFAGRADDPRKNIGLLLKAFRIIASQDPNVELHLTGDAAPSINKLVHKLGISDRVKWVGWLDHSALAQFYRSLDVFVLPSSKEGLAIAGVEAMATGIPVVSTHSGGPEDFVINGVTGRLVENDPDEMAQAIRAIYNDRHERRRMSDNARSLIKEKYTMEQFELSISEHWHQTWGDAL